MLRGAKKVSRDVANLPSVPKELVARFLTGPMNGEAIETAGIAFKKALIEAALNAELGHHLGYEAGADRPDDVTNHRNGGTSKTVLTGDGQGPDRDAARPRRQFRAVACPQARAPVYRLRRQDRGAVCARPDGARDPGLSR